MAFAAAAMVGALLIPQFIPTWVALAIMPWRTALIVFVATRLISSPRFQPPLRPPQLQPTHPSVMRQRLDAHIEADRELLIGHGCRCQPSETSGTGRF